MVLYKEHRKPQCIKKAGIVNIDIKRPFEATQSYLIDTQKYNSPSSPSHVVLREICKPTPRSVVCLFPASVDVFVFIVFI